MEVEEVVGLVVVVVVLEVVVEDGVLVDVVMELLD